MAPVSIFRGPALSTRRHQVIASLCAVAAIAAGVTFYPRTKAAAQAPKKAQLVTIVATRTAAMPIDLDAQGHVVPLNFVDVRPQLAGPVSVTTADGKETGQLVFIDNTIHADSATISLKASFPNAHQTLWPGGFARIVVHAGTSASAVVLPPQAVQEGPSGRFVFALNADGTVRQQAVTLLRVQDGSAVIAGLADGVKVVQEGGQNLRAGMAVQVAGTP